MTISEWERAFPDENACCALSGWEPLAGWRRLPRCGNVKVKPHGTMFVELALQRVLSVRHQLPFLPYQRHGFREHQ